MDFTLYWFMFPIAIMVATTAMMSGIAGAALFMPIFLLVFPLLGPEYELNSPVVSIAAALITSTFGFASGFVGYFRKNLIDFQQAKRFIKVSIPLAILGAFICPMMDSDLIRGLYGLLMLGIAFILLSGSNKSSAANAPKSSEPLQSRLSSDGQNYEYRFYTIKNIPTALGGFLTGLLSTGIGEVVMPQLVKDGRFPIPVAAATSVLVVISTFIFASFAHLYSLINEGGISAVPWHLVAYTIPGVIIGGQIGPRLQGKIPRPVMVKGIAFVFILIGMLMLIAFVKTKL